MYHTKSNVQNLKSCPTLQLIKWEIPKRKGFTLSLWNIRSQIHMELTTSMKFLTLNLV